MNHLENYDLVKSLVEKKNRYYDTLKPKFEILNNRWKRYVGESLTPDTRKAGVDDWKSKVSVPKATANTDAVSATVTNIICSSSPMIQVTKSRDLDVDAAEYGEKICGYMLRGNKFRSRILPALARNAEIQEMQVLKLQWIDRSRKVTSIPSLEEMEHFWNEIAIQSKKLGVDYPDPQTDFAGFKIWLEGMKQTGNDFPNMPQPISTSKAAYIGPWYTLPFYGNMFYDPFVEDPQEQEVIFERKRIPQSYLMALSDPEDENAPFDREAVLRGLSRSSSSRFSIEETAYYQTLGLDTSLMDGQTEPFGIVLEAYMPTHPEVQFGVILNEDTFINKDVVNPNPSGDIPYSFVQRKRISNSALGQSPYKHNGPLLDELSTLESAKLNITAITSEPSFTRKGAKAGSMQGLEDYLGGKIYDVSDHGDMQQIEVKVPNALFQENAYLEATIDMGWGVGGNVRGQQATTGRIPLGETQARLTQATLPLIEFAREIEDAIITTIPWAFNMFYEYGDETTRLKLLNRLETLDMAKISQILEMDFVFTGATQAGNRGELAQLILMWTKEFREALRPDEYRAFAKATATLLGIPDMNTIMTEQPPMMPPDPSLAPPMDPNAPVMPSGAPTGAPTAPNLPVPPVAPAAR